jgi:SNF2 family DNA or RNA helicase
MLNANDMGMGKTIETVITIYILQAQLQQKLGRKPTCLWLTKKSLMKKSSPNEVRKWNPAATVVVPADGADPMIREFMVELYLEQEADIFMCNYEYLRTTPKAFETKWDIIVIDEVHKLKGGANSNGPTTVWKYCRKVCLEAEFVLMLSGTPMVNAPEEMWSYLHIFHPDRFPTLKKFKKDFASYKNIAGQLTLTVDPLKILNTALRGQMIRRSAEEVGLQIPPLNYEILDLERTPQQDVAYKQMEKQFFIWLDEQEDKPLAAMAVIAQLTRLRQINVWPSDIHFRSEDEWGNEIDNVLDIRESSKIDETIDIIENAADQVVVFCTLNNPFKEIQRRCKEELHLRCEIINGQVKNDFDEEYEFQQGKIDVLCLNSAMGEGLNLQKNKEYWPGGSRYGILLDRWWSPGRNEQCFKRIQRQGSLEPVFIKELQNISSVDQLIQSINEDKEQKFNTIMASDKIRPASEWKSYFQGLMKGD